jgi:hypothetical protein
MYINTYKRFSWKMAVQIVPITSGSAIISIEALFRKWPNSKLRIVSLLAETFYSLFLRKYRGDMYKY